eukprot:TRINITY_DN5322_c0_g1_i6.p1 TRINITY_DN5322_c0_g1~~TRINITY_DN5322_c0_g1_i6.p1  ORF type:complete len:286 (-),score=64.12 TRINITY_DN5322_c0_g1_i6:309-1136(-)
MAKDKKEKKKSKGKSTDVHGEEKSNSKHEKAEPEGKSIKKSKSKRNTKKLESGVEISTPPPQPQSSKTKKPKEEPKEEDEDLGDVITKYSRKVTKDDFELMTVIGRGSFGKVMQVRKKDTKEVYAMKVMRKEAIIQKNQIAHTKDEKAILQQIEHPFIVKLHYAFQTKDKLYMILDYVNGGELFYHLKKEGKFKVDRVRFYAAEITSAMDHLHSLGIVYRDLKPENILLDKDGHIVITDFGLSKVIPKDDKEGTETFCGTPEYLAPEGYIIFFCY